MANSKAKDNVFKVIFDEPELFIAFLQDFVEIDLFDDLQPSDIEDISERYLPLFQDSKDSDTVKRINLKGDVPLFVIAILEHESKVNYRASFKMLQYIALVLDDYEKEVNKKKDKASFAKQFKYPPVLPIVFYDGLDKWTSELNFIDKTELNEVFHKYIPKFEYELVSLNEYSQEDIVKFGDALSVIMLIDKIRKPGDMSKLKDLPENYMEQLKLHIPQSLTKLLADVIRVLLKRIHVPDEEIDEVSDAIYERRYNEMFSFFDNYDVQETRRKSEEIGVKKAQAETLRNMVKSNFSLAQMSAALAIPEDDIQKMLDELEIIQQTQP